MPRAKTARNLRLALIVALAALSLWGCATKPLPPPPPPPPPAPPPPPPPPPPPAELDLHGAVLQIAGDLARQLGPSAERVLTIDPILDRATGQQTLASARLEAELGPALAATMEGWEIMPFGGDSVAKTRLVLTGTVTTTEDPDRYTVSVALADRGSGLVVAQAAARFRQEDFDSAPTKFYDDSPSLVLDRSVEGYVRTSVTSAGEPADVLYIEQIPTGALLAEALAAYNDGRWEQALAFYGAAAQRTDGQQLRTFNGLYLANVRLGRLEAAEEAFGKIVALGLATNNLAVKFLFRAASSSEFWPSPELSGMYPMWLRQIARAVQSSGSCLNIVGHTSHTGTPAANDRLSLARAQTVKRLLETEVPSLGRQLGATGVGFSQNIIGTGTDDASDAVDRRVEFSVVACE